MFDVEPSDSLGQRKPKRFVARRQEVRSLHRPVIPRQHHHVCSPRPIEDSLEIAVLWGKPIEFIELFLWQKIGRHHSPASSPFGANMSLKKLTTAQMLERSSHWLGAGRAKLEAYEETAGALDLLERSHEALEATAKSDPNVADEMHELTLKLGQLDLLHDRRVRGIYHILTGLGEALDDETMAEHLHNLRSTLLPAGINTTLLSYNEQAEAARAASGVLTDEDRALLSRVPMPNEESLLDQVEDWLRVGEELGEMWQKREGAKARSGGVTPSDTVRARNRWIGAVRVLLAALDAAQLSVEERRALLSLSVDTDASAASELPS